VARALPFTSSQLSSGWVSLRNEWQGNRAWIGLNALIPGGGHQHADRLTLLSYQQGQLLALEKATPYNESVTRNLGTLSPSHSTVTVDGTTHRMADPFQVLATMNPFDHDGTFPLPAAQIDRFMIMLELGLPSLEDEVRVLDTHLAETHSATPIAAVVSAESFLEWQKTVPLVHASPDVKHAAVRYVDGLRRSISNGHAVSPRATIAWLRASQARAMLAGREFVTVEDLLDVAPEIFRHRLWISPPEIRDRLRAMGAR
jgi:MoxR-like ATPase